MYQQKLVASQRNGVAEATEEKKYNIWSIYISNQEAYKLLIRNIFQVKA